MNESVPSSESVISSPVQASSAVPKSSKSGVMYFVIAFLVILFIGIGGTVAYLLLSKNDEGGKEDNEGDEIVAENEEDGIQQTCTYNDTVYDDGESFPSTDGCNTCTCTDGSLSCTEIDCQDGDDGGVVGNQTETREFVVEYWEGDGGAITLEADLPVGATIEQGNYTHDIWGPSVGTKIIYDDFELFFTIPHMGGMYKYDDSMDELNSEYIPNLYRVIPWKDGEYTGTKFYVSDPTLSGICDNQFGDDVEAPCGGLYLHFEVEAISSVVIRYGGVDEKIVQADAIMETIRVVSD